MLRCDVSQEEPKSSIDEKIREYNEAQLKESEKAAKAKTRSNKPALPRSATASSLSKDVSTASPPVWDDVGYTIKVLLFANRLQLLR